MTQRIAELWAIATLGGSVWLAVHVLLSGVPDPVTGVDVLDLLLRVAGVAQEAWGGGLTALGIVVTGVVLAVCCFFPGVGGEGGYLDGFDGGDGCGDGD